MKTGTEDRKKLIVAACMGVVALGSVAYELAGSSDTPAGSAAPAPAIARVAPAPVSARMPGAALDPSLHPEAMLATEALLYTGSGRNIFSANAEPVARVDLPKAIAPVRTQPAAPVPVNLGPPPPPPIELRFFGTAQRPGARRQAFFLRGDDVFLASEGDIVSRRYRVGTIGATSAQVTDLTNNNTQTLPLVMQ